MTRTAFSHPCVLLQLNLASTVESLKKGWGWGVISKLFSAKSFFCCENGRDCGKWELLSLEDVKWSSCLLKVSLLLYIRTKKYNNFGNRELPRFNFQRPHNELILLIMSDTWHGSQWQNLQNAYDTGRNTSGVS